MTRLCPTPPLPASTVGTPLFPPVPPFTLIDGVPVSVPPCITRTLPPPPPPLPPSPLAAPPVDTPFAPFALICPVPQVKFQPTSMIKQPPP